MRILALLVLLASVHAQQRVSNLTVSQREADFRQLVGTFAKNYGPQAYKNPIFDILVLNGPKPNNWLERLRAPNMTDYEFADLLVEWISKLNDAHARIVFPSKWTAKLGFTVDFYNGKLIVDSKSLSSNVKPPIDIGDELISLDGNTVEEWKTRLRPFSMRANERSTNRLIAAQMMLRMQSLIPTAPDFTPNVSLIEFRRGGVLNRHEAVWTKTGEVMQFAPVFSSDSFQAPKIAIASEEQLELDDDYDDQFGSILKPHLQAALPSELRTLLALERPRLPMFGLPSNFRVRVGEGSADSFFYSGAFTTSTGLSIGYVRIPTFDTTALKDRKKSLDDFRIEMTKLERETAGVIIDVMHNPGGDLLFCQDLLSIVVPTQMDTVGFQIRATSSWVEYFDAAIANSTSVNRGDLQWVLSQIKDANQQKQGLTGVLPLTDTGTLKLNAVAKTINSGRTPKPLLVLTDDVSASAADFFPAVLKSNGKAKIAGIRTVGAGGNVRDYGGTTYTEANVSVTESLMVTGPHSGRTATAPPPITSIIENNGVSPDYEIDFMTVENLLHPERKGKPFLDKVLRVMEECVIGKQVCSARP